MTPSWDYMICANLPPETRELGSLAVGDIDGDGLPEMILGGGDGLFWFRPDTHAIGKIGPGNFHVGLVIEELDGRPAVVCGEATSAPGQPEAWGLAWYRPGSPDLNAPWEKGWIADFPEGGPHDIVFSDLDGCGERELVTNACYTPTPGVFAFKRGLDLNQPWQKIEILQEVFAEGLAVGDLDGDGLPEIVNGPDWFHMPPGGAFAGRWIRRTFAPNFREMCRAALVDITGSGRPDIVIADSEYMDGFLSWFENRLAEDPDHPWVEHRLENGLVYTHSLDVRRSTAHRAPFPASADGPNVHIFVAEMDAGGWNAPYNLDARLIVYTTADRGQTWQREVLFQGEGTHQAVLADLDGDGWLEVAGKTYAEHSGLPKIQVWKWKEQPALNVTFHHRFLDRDKPYTAIEVLPVDVDGDGLVDVACGAWWYRAPNWRRYEIPGVYQVITAADLDGDGRQELVGIKRKPGAGPDFYSGLCSDLWWFKPLDPLQGAWEEHYIGQGSGDWPHGSLVAPLLPGGRLALVACYHDAQETNRTPDLFEVPYAADGRPDPAHSPWPRRCLAEDAPYNEEITAVDVNADGRLDLIGGQWWFENLGDGRFQAHRLAEGYLSARQAIANLHGDGRPDLVLGQEVMDYPNRFIPFSRLSWFENCAAPDQPWPAHPIDDVRCAHSVGAADLDGDGEMEIIIGEHDPFWPYRKRCRLFAYKKADPRGQAWYRYLIDGRFEHHDGAKVIPLPGGKTGILSIGWQDSIYVNLWEVEKG